MTFYANIKMIKGYIFGVIVGKGTGKKMENYSNAMCTENGNCFQPKVAIIKSWFGNVY